jgi:uncharacterized protein (DUF433 family)
VLAAWAAAPTALAWGPQVSMMSDEIPMSETMIYDHLAPREGSRYRQYFIKGRNLRAETLYRATLGPEPMTPEEVAADYDVPVEAVREALDYCLHHAELLREEREADRAESQPRGRDDSSPLASGARA